MKGNRQAAARHLMADGDQGVNFYRQWGHRVGLDSAGMMGLEENYQGHGWAGGGVHRSPKCQDPSSKPWSQAGGQFWLSKGKPRQG